MAFLSLLLKGIVAPILALTVYILFNELLRWRSRISGLNGPKGLPLIGNLLDV